MLTYLIFLILQVIFIISCLIPKKAFSDKFNRKCAVAENTHTSPWKVNENSKGEGVAIKPEFFKEMYGAKLEILEGWGSKPKNFLWGRYGYFLEPHNSTQKHLHGKCSKHENNITRKILKIKLQVLLPQTGLCDFTPYFHF